MRAMVFAAGLGTRLRPLTELLPKPVVPLLHRPLAWFAIDHLARAGASEIVINTHHLAERAEEALARAPRVDGVTSIAFAREATLLGTGGGVKHAVEVQSRALGRSLGEDEVLVAFNGDVLFAPDLAAAIAHHRACDALATMVVRASADAARLGAIEVDAEGRVRRMLASAPDPSLRACMFTGVHVLSARAVAMLPEQGCIVRKGYVPWLARGERIAGYVERAPFRDLGTPREYLAAHLDLLRGEIAWPGLDARALAIDPGASIDATARAIESCVGAGARVGGGVTLERCVVWPGTVVRADARDAILAGEHVVAADGAPGAG